MLLANGALTRVALPVSLASEYKRLDLSGMSVAGTQGGLFFTSDNGASWKDVTPAAMYTPATSHLVLPDGRILVGSGGSGVFNSNDGGMSWVGWSIGLGTANTIKALALYDKGILAATENGLMWTAVEGEPRWKFRAGGIGRVPLSDMVVEGDRIWVASGVGGLFVSEKGSDFKAVKGFEGRISDLSASGGRIAAVVDQAIVIGGDNGQKTVSQRLPEGAVATSVEFFSGKLYAGSTVGVFVQEGDAWIRTGSIINPMLYPTSRLMVEGKRLKVVTSGSGTYYLQ